MKRLAIVMFGGYLISIPCVFAGEIDLLDIFKNQLYDQTSGAAPTSVAGYFANIQLVSVDPGAFDGVKVSYPGPSSPDTLPQISPTLFGDGPSFATQAAMDAAVPFGEYVYTATNSVTSDVETATLTYSADAFTSAVPALTSATFNGLNGLDPSTALTIAFNSFMPAGNATYGQTFFSIYDTSGTVFTADFLDPSTTSVLLPMDTLLPNTTYGFELDFSDRQNGEDSATGVFTVVASDVRTDGSFTTGAIAPATPEPGTILLSGLGLLGLAAFRRRARRSSTH